MIKNTLIAIVVSLWVTLCSSEQPEPVTVKSKDGTEAVIRVTNIRRYPQDYDEGTPCRTASSQQNDPEMTAMEPDAGNEVHFEQPNQAIEYLLLGLNKRSGVDMQFLLDGVVSFHAEAVPSLIEAYGQTDDELCWPLVYCLCQIKTPEALEFVRGIMQEHAKRFSTLAAIKIYPEENDDEIIGILIDLLNVREYRTKASEKLQDSVYRKPERAGQLVAALQDDPEFDGTYIYGVLADVSAYRYSWTVVILSSQDRVAKLNNFWRDWWTRNKEKDVFGWLEEAASSNNETRQCTALQRMRMYADERALPYYLAGLDSASKRVQNQSIVGLRTMESSYPSGGYRSDGTELEKKREILRLKKKYGRKSLEPELSRKEQEALQYASAMAGRSEKELAELRHRDVPPAVRKKLHALFKEYYPDVKYEYLDLNGIRFKYKTKRVEYPLARKGLYATHIDQIPEPAGILCSIACMQGPYAGPTPFVPRPDGQCPSRLIKKPTHDILMMTPYCEESDVHLGVNLEYPPNTNADFLKAFKQIMEQFVEGSVADEEDYFSLTSSDGTMAHAKVLSYDEKSDMALIENENHEQRTVSPNFFCNTDASLIRNWELVDSFMNNAELNVSIQRVEEKIVLNGREVPDEHTMQNYMGMDYYTIDVRNNTDREFSRIKVEVIRYLTRELLNPGQDAGKITKLQVPTQVFDMDTIKAGNHTEISTRKLKAESIIVEKDSSVMWKDVMALQGVWIRMTMKLSDGVEITRDIKEPERLWIGFSWRDATQSIGLN